MAEELSKEQKRAKSQIDQYKKITKKGDSLIEGYLNQHMGLYNKIMASHVGNNSANPEDWDLEKLKKKDVVDKIIKEFQNEYNKLVKNYLTSTVSPKEPIQSIKGWWANRQLKQALYGINDAELETFIRNSAEKGNFNHEAYKNYILNSHLSSVKHAVDAGAIEHIKKEHVPDILKFIGADEHLEDVDLLKVDKYKLALPEIIDRAEKDEEGNYSISYKSLQEANQKLKENYKGQIDLEPFLPYKKDAA